MTRHTTRGLAMSDNDFFIVLPSNACPKVHPDNFASSFIVSWENPLHFNTKDWRVALTEMSYNFTPMPSKEDFAIQFTKREPRFLQTVAQSIEWDLLKKPSGFVKLTPYKGFNMPVSLKDIDGDVLKGVELLKDGKIVITSPYPFELIAASDLTMKELGISKETSKATLHQDSSTYQLMLKVENSAGTSGDFDLVYWFSPSDNVYAFPFPQVKTTEQLVNVMKTLSKLAIESVEIVDAGLVKMSFLKDIQSVKMLHGLNYVCGFRKNFYTRTDNEKPFILTADYVPQLNRGIDHMYIYASCCAPTRVGDAEVPLLRHFFIEDNDHKPYENPYGKAKNFIIRNPMYMSIASTSINSIEVNIRDDSGRLVSFDEGAKTSLTLHFKRQDND